MEIEIWDLGLVTSHMSWDLGFSILDFGFENLNINVRSQTFVYYYHYHHVLFIITYYIRRRLGSYLSLSQQHVVAARKSMEWRLGR